MQNEDQIYSKLMEMSEDIGAIKASIEKVSNLDTRVSALEAVNQRRQGVKGVFTTGWSIVISVFAILVAIFHH